MPNVSKPPTVQLSDEVVIVQQRSGNTPLTNGERAETKSVTIKSVPYPDSRITDLNWIEVVDAAQSGLGMTFEYDEQRKSLYIILGTNHEVGAIKRRRRITKENVLTHWKWLRRVVVGNWDRDLDQWIEEDETREARRSSLGSFFAPPDQPEEQELRREIEAGRKIDYLELWRTRAHKWGRILEFSCLGVAITIANLNVPDILGIPVSIGLFVAAWILDEVKSKNRRWKARS